jgi:hypothetical protein
MNAIMRIGVAAATTLALIGSLIGEGQLIPTPALAGAELHNVTYVARVDGVAPGSQATFLIHDNETSSAELSAIPGNAFEANTVLADPNKAGMQVSIPWPYAANVHCEIDVDDNVATQVDRSVGLALGNNDPNRTVSCGAPLTDTTAAAATDAS